MLLYAAVFHWDRDLGDASIPAMAAKTNPPPSPSYHHRGVFAALFGSVRTHFPQSNKLRRELYRQCGLAGGQQQQQLFNRSKSEWWWRPVEQGEGNGQGQGQESCEVCVSAAIPTNRDTAPILQISEVYMRSVFCFQPPGEKLTDGRTDD